MGNKWQQIRVIGKTTHQTSPLSTHLHEKLDEKEAVNDSFPVAIHLYGKVIPFFAHRELIIL